MWKHISEINYFQRLTVKIKISFTQPPYIYMTVETVVGVVVTTTVAVTACVSVSDDMCWCGHQ